MGEGHLRIARIEMLRGNPSGVRNHLRNVTHVRHESFAEAGKYYARIVDIHEAENLLMKLKRELQGSEVYENRALLKLLEGEIELAKGNRERVFDLLSDAARYPWRCLYLQVQDSLGQAALASGHFDVAADAYKAITKRRGFAFRWQRPDDWIMAEYGLATTYEKWM